MGHSVRQPYIRQPYNGIRSDNHGISNQKSHYDKALNCAEDFAYAGLSAILLIIAGLFQSCQYIEFAALVPFIYRLYRLSGKSTWRLGLLFGAAYYGVLSIDSFFMAPLAASGKFVGAVVLFTVFTGSLGWFRKRFGFNPVFIALFWTGLEYGLIKLGLSQGIFGQSGLSLPFFGALSTIFGFIIISFVIILINSLLVLAIDKVVKLVSASDSNIPLGEKGWSLGFLCEAGADNNFLIPESRGPPLLNGI